MAGLFGCGEKEYKLIFERGGFESAKTKYAAGEDVTVYYKTILTDTDYYFSFDGVDCERDYEPEKGYIFRFVMPERDVRISYESRNSMTMDPGAHVNDHKTAAAAEGEVPEGWWRCPDCGNVNEGQFCAECGCRKPEG